MMQTRKYDPTRFFLYTKHLYALPYFWSICMHCMYIYIYVSYRRRFKVTVSTFLNFYAWDYLALPLYTVYLVFIVQLTTVGIYCMSCQSVLGSFSQKFLRSILIFKENVRYLIFITISLTRILACKICRNSITVLTLL